MIRVLDLIATLGFGIALMSSVTFALATRKSGTRGSHCW